jgi:glycosyltransferase involved in cell wall biosynthesis
MKLFFDARYIRPDFHDGISRYSASMGSALAGFMPVTFLICDDRQRDFLPEKAKVLSIHGPTSIKEPFTALILNKYQPDAVFSPMQTIGSFGRKFRLILTLHDMIYYRHRTPPKELPALIRLGWRLFHLTYIPQRLVLNRADMVVTVSETVKKQFQKVKLTKRPIVAIPSAPKLFEKPPKVIHSDIPRNIVYMGSFMPYKNAETLIRAMKWLPGRTLHLLSRVNEERERELRLLIPRGAEVIFHRGVTDAEYAQILADDAIFATASLDEGYGLPVAEAMALGVPAVVSDLEIFHEVASDAALFFDPRNPRDFAARIKELNVPTLRRRLIATGKKRMKQFTWEASAKALKAAIKTLR